MINVYVGNNLDRKPYPLPEDTTLREAFTKAGVNYSAGMNTLDGVPLGQGDIDKTFKEMNVKADTCYLLNAAKSANATEVVAAAPAETVAPAATPVAKRALPKISVLGDRGIIDCGFTRDEIATLEQYRPEALSLLNADKIPTFSVCLSKGDGVVNGISMEFGTVKVASGNATVAFKIEAGKDPKEYAEELVGSSILKLRKLVGTWDTALAEIAAEKKEVLDTIDVG